MIITKGPLDILKKSIFLIPAILLLVLFFVAPIALTIYYSFTNLSLTGSTAQNLQFTGLENYKMMLSDPNTFVSIVNTLVFLVGSLIGQQLIGFILAYNMKNRNKTFRSIVGPIILSSWVMPEMVVALCASSFFDHSGTLNQILGFFGMAPVEWLYKHAMISVILANIWRGTAFSMMVFQSALDSVPKEIEEAAVVDGATSFQALTKITIPCIKDTIATNTMLNTLQTLGVFGLIYAITGGGPGTAMFKSTLTLPIHMYKQAFVSFQLGYGTAISMILLLLGIVLSGFYARLFSKNN